jgi:hypothetical protein
MYSLSPGPLLVAHYSTHPASPKGAGCMTDRVRRLQAQHVLISIQETQETCDYSGLAYPSHARISLFIASACVVMAGLRGVDRPTRM